MHDLSFFRTNLDTIAQRLSTRGYQLDVDQFRALDEKRREALTEAERLKAQRNELSAQIPKLKAEGKDISATQQESGAMRERISLLDEKAKAVDESFRP